MFGDQVLALPAVYHYKLQQFYRVVQEQSVTCSSLQLTALSKQRIAADKVLGLCTHLVLSASRTVVVCSSVLGGSLRQQFFASSSWLYLIWHVLCCQGDLALQQSATCSANHITLSGWAGTAG
jgi:hypothetical protein